MIGMAEVTVCALSGCSLLVILSGHAMPCKHTHTHTHKKNKNAVELRVIETM